MLLSKLSSLIKPLNPIEISNGNKVKKFTLILRIKNFFLKIFFEKKISVIDVVLILKHLLIKIISILYLPLAIILFILGYRFIYVAYWQIGTMALHINSIIKKINIENKNSKKYIFLSPKIFCANPGLNEIYKQKILICENLIIYIILMPFLEIEFISENPYHIEYGEKNGKSFLIDTLFKKKYKKNLIYKYSKFKNSFYRQMIKKKNININKNLVIINLRSNFPHKSSRSVNEEAYINSIKFLLKKNYSCIVYSEYKFKIKHKNFNQIKIVNNEDKYLQVFLYSLAKFCIVSESGPRFLANLFDKPCYCTNLIPYSAMFSYNKKDLSIVQKIYSKESKKILNLDEIFFKFNLQNFYKSSEKIIYIKNSSDEIFKGLNEFLNHLNKSNNTYINFSNKIKDEYLMHYSESFYGNGIISKSLFSKLL